MLFFNSNTHQSILNQQTKRFQQTLQPIHRLQNKLTGRITATSSTPINPSLLISGNNHGRIQIQDLRKINNTYINPMPSLSTTLQHSKGGVIDICWFPHDDGAFASLGGTNSSYGNTRTNVTIWNVDEFSVELEFDIEPPCYCMAWANSFEHTQTIAVGCRDGTIRLLDLNTGNSTHTIRAFLNTSVSACGWSIRDEFILACGSSDGQVKLFDIRKPVESFIVLDEFDGISQQYTTSTNNETSTTKRIRQTYQQSSNAATTIRGGGPKFAHHHSTIKELQFVNNGKCILTGGTDNILRLWKLNGNGYQRVFVDYPTLWFDGYTGRRLAFSDSFCTIFAPSKRPNNHVLKAFDGGWGENNNNKTTSVTTTTLTGHVKPIDCIICRDELQEIITVSGEDGCFVVWEPTNGNNEIHGNNNNNNNMEIDDDDW